MFPMPSIRPDHEFYDDMKANFVKYSSIFGTIGWTLIVLFAAVTDGIGDGSPSGENMPISFFLPFIYFGICIISCFPVIYFPFLKWVFYIAGIIGTICLGGMFYFLIRHGWFPICAVLLVPILLCHGTLWWLVLIERIKKLEVKAE